MGGVSKGEVVDVSSYDGETWYAGKKNIIKRRVIIILKL